MQDLKREKLGLSQGLSREAAPQINEKARNDVGGPFLNGPFPRGLMPGAVRRSGALTAQAGLWFPGGSVS